MRIENQYYGTLTIKGEYYGKRLNYIPVKYLKNILNKFNLDHNLKSQILDRIKNEEEIRFSNYTTNPIQKTFNFHSFIIDIMKNNHHINLIEKGWILKFNKSKRSAGKCSYGVKGKFIILSEIFLKLHNENKIKDTITHEISHAIDVEQRGYSNHDLFWKNIHKSLGGSGNTNFNLTKTEQKELFNYLAICPIHGIIGGWIRKPKIKGYIRTCKHCGEEIKIINN